MANYIEYVVLLLVEIYFDLKSRSYMHITLPSTFIFYIA